MNKLVTADCQAIVVS